MEITLKERNTIDNILDVTKKISHLYYKLTGIEICYKGSNCNDYKVALEQLRGALKVEELLYESLEITPDKGNSLIGYVISTERSFKEEENSVLDAINCRDIEYLVIHRIIRRLETISKKDNSLVCEWLLARGMFLSIKQASEFVLFENFEKTIEADFETAFINYNENNIRNCGFEDAIDVFSGIKHNLAFLSQNIEQGILDYNFLKSDEVFFNFPFVAEVHRINDRVVERAQMKACCNYCKTAVNEIIKPNKLINPAVFWQSKVFIPYLQAGLSIGLPLETYEDITEKLKKEVTEYSEKHENDFSESVKLICDTVDNLENNRVKCKYLHLIPRK